MLDRSWVLSLISSLDHCQRSSQSQIFNTPRVGFETLENLSLGFVESNFAAVITTTPLYFNVLLMFYLIIKLNSENTCCEVVFSIEKMVSLFC